MTDAKRFWEEWPTTEVGRWNEARKKLNRLIRMVNQWTIDGMPRKRKQRILGEIECAQTTWAEDESYMDDLSEMREYVSAAEEADGDESDEADVVRSDDVRRIIARYALDATGDARNILADLRELVDERELVDD